MQLRALFRTTYERSIRPLRSPSKATRAAATRFTRLTNAFSKKIESHVDMVALYMVFFGASPCRRATSQTVSTPRVATCGLVLPLTADVASPVKGSPFDAPQRPSSPHR